MSNTQNSLNYPVFTISNYVLNYVYTVTAISWIISQRTQLWVEVTLLMHKTCIVQLRRQNIYSEHNWLPKRI